MPNYMDLYGGGVQLPFNNLLQQYTQSMFHQPLTPTFQWAQRAPSGGPTPRRGIAGMLGGFNAPSGLKGGL
jgi:hypothetical protein